MSHAAAGPVRGSEKEVQVKRMPFMLSVMLGLAVVGQQATLPGASAQDSTPAECATTTEDENIALITRQLEAMASGDDVSVLIAPERTVHLPNGEDIVNTSENSPWVEDRQDDYPEMTATLEQIIAQDDMVAAYVTWAGTQEGDNEDLGVPATGRAAEWASFTLFRIECGKIAEIWPVADNLGMLMDLGVITQDELASVAEVATPTP